MLIWKHLEGLVSSKLASVKAVLLLIKLEARLATLSLFSLVVNIVFLGAIITTLWLSIMVLVGYGVFCYLHHFLITMGVLVGINLVVFFIIYHALKSNLSNMSFKRTRDYLSEQGAFEHVSTEKTIRTRDSDRCKPLDG